MIETREDRQCLFVWPGRRRRKSEKRKRVRSEVVEKNEVERKMSARWEKSREWIVWVRFLYRTE